MNNDENNVYLKVKEFKRKYPKTIAWRLKQNSKVVQMHLNPGEKVLYAFCGQKNNNVLDIITTCVVAITNRRLIIGQKRVVFGYFYYAITPDMYNDLQVRKGLIWGDVIIDTIKEVVYISNVDPDGLIEIETAVTEYMMREKKKYKLREDHDISNVDNSNYEN